MSARIELALVVAIPLLLVACAATPEATPGPEPATQPAARADQPGPGPKPNDVDVLAGTSWRVTSVVGDIAQTITSATFEFGDDGVLRVSIVRSDRDPVVREHAYEVSGGTLRLDDVFGWSRAEFARFGDELTIQSRDLRIALRQTGGAEEPAVHVERTAAAEPIDHPIADTRWTLATAFGNADARYTGGTFDFTRDGRVEMSLTRDDGTTLSAMRRYRIEGELMRVSDEIGTELTATFELTPSRLVIDTTKSRLVLDAR